MRYGKTHPPPHHLDPLRATGTVAFLGSSRTPYHPGKMYRHILGACTTIARRIEDQTGYTINERARG